MKYSKGDIVKITVESSGYVGETGTVTEVWASDGAMAVNFAEGGEFGYFSDEVELVKGVDEDEQVAKLASVLYNEPGNEDWDMEQSHAAAVSLYKAGVRHRG